MNNIHIIRLLLLGCFTLPLLIGFEPPKKQLPKKSKAEIEVEDREFQELADQMAEWLQETEKAEKKRKEQEVTEKKQAQEREVVAARKLIEDEMIAARKRQEVKRLEQILNDILKTFTQYKPTNIEYLSTFTAQELLSVINALEEDTAQFNASAQQLKTSPLTLGQFLIDLKQRLRNEIAQQKQEESSKNEGEISLKNLLIKSESGLPDIKNMMLKSLQEKLDSIEKLLHDSFERDHWALELKCANGKLLEVLRQLQKHLKASIAGIESMVLKDSQLSATRMANEERERVCALEFAKVKKAEETFERFAQIKQKFPKFFEEVPANLQLPFLNNFEAMYVKDKKVEDVIDELFKKPAELINTWRWIVLGDALGYNSYYNAGYVFFDNGPRSRGILLPKYLEKQSQLNWENNPEQRKKLQDELDTLGQDLVKTYKIHLMPAENIDMIRVLLVMDRAIKKDPAFKALIKTFKILDGSQYRRRTEHGDIAVFPKVVIYAEGKENAQKILDKVYQIFKDMPGLDVQPRYNARVNDLIWIAQGDGDYKGERYAANYERPFDLNGRVYYRKDITGNVENYHLKYPLLSNKDIE